MNDVNRWEDPQARRWASKDPIDLMAGDTNPGRYAGNSPTNATDPTGLMSNRHLTVQEKKFFYFIFRCVLPGADPADIAAVLAQATLYDTTAGSTGFWDSLSDNTSPYTLAARVATQSGNAEAITFGHDIYFRKLPMQNSPASLSLIGHELVHSLHVEALHLGRPLWVTSYLLDCAKNGYNGNISEIAAYAMSDTIEQLLVKYPNLLV